MVDNSQNHVGEPIVQLKGMDHFALEVRPYKINDAVALFTALGYTEQRARRRDEGWGSVAFLEYPGMVLLQLTSLIEGDLHIVTEFHPGLKVDSPKDAVDAVIALMKKWGYKARKESANDGKLFVYVDELLLGPIEFVPA